MSTQEENESLKRRNKMLQEQLVKALEKIEEQQAVIKAAIMKTAV